MSDGESSLERVLAVAAGTAQFSTLTGPERQEAHRLIGERTAATVDAARFGQVTARFGHPVVYLDDAGALVEEQPDGTILPL